MATLRIPGLDVTEFNFAPPQPSAVPGISVSEGAAPERITSLRNPSFETATSPQRAAYERSLTTPNAPAAAPAAPGLAQRATGALRSGFDSLRGTGSVPRQLGRVGLRAAGPIAGLAVEGAQAADVATNPNATGLDVATQVAQGAGRLGAAGAGAAIGATAGSVVPVVGTVLGGLAGGAAGYFGADKLIEGGRRLFGTDPRAPADRLDNPAAPAAPVTPAGAGGGRGVVNPPAVDPSAPPPTVTPPAFFTRTGNSFAGTGDNQVQAAGLRNPNVSTVPGAGATETYAMADRIRANNAVTPTGPSVINAGFADRNAEFNENANLRNAASQQTWSPRRGYQGNEDAVKAASIPVANRQRLREAGIRADSDLATTRLSTDAARANAQTQADATRYSADSTVRAAGLRAGYDMQLKLGDRMAQAEALRQAGGDPARAARILAASGRDPSTLTSLTNAEQTRDAQTQTVQDKAIDNTRRALQVFDPATGKVNDGASAAAYNVVNKILPNFSNMSEAAREKALPQAQALASIFGKTYQNQQQGLQKLNPFNPRAPQLDSMPDFQGGKLVRQGLLAGAMTPGSSANDYYVTDRNGVNHPLGQLNERELQLIERNIKTGKWN